MNLKLLCRTCSVVISPCDNQQPRLSSQSVSSYFLIYLLTNLPDASPHFHYFLQKIHTFFSISPNLSRSHFFFNSNNTTFNSS